MIAFFDASALIYLIEGAEPFATRVRAEVAAHLAQYPDAPVAVSRLTWLESRVRPLRAGDSATLAAYDAFFERPDLIWLELTREVVELATVIRARHGLRTPDALQAACCLQLGDDHVLFTGDAAFRRVSGLNVNCL